MSSDPHELAARQRKALALVDAVNAFVETAKILDVSGAEWVDWNPESIAAALRTQSPQWWAQLAAKAGVNPPSPETIELVCAAFDMRERMAELASLRDQRHSLAKELDEEDAKRARRRHARRSW